MSVELTGVDAMIRDLRKEVEDLEKTAVKEVQRAGYLVLEALLSQTPVWSGETAAAYGVGIGSVGTGSAGFTGGPPGPTNSQSMGVEANRGVAESVSRARVTGVISGMRKLADLHFGNGVGGTKWELLDSGQAPGGPGQQIRNPAGIARPAEVIAKARAGDNFR